MRTRVLLRECVAECLGMWLMVFLGIATVGSSITTGVQAGIWQVAVVWGFAVALAIYLTAHVSGAHLNPAVTISLACSGSPVGFPKYKVLPYVAAQLIGAMFRGVCVLAFYGSGISRYEDLHSITRAREKRVIEQGDVSPYDAMAVEAIGTMVLMLLIRALMDDSNYARPSEQQTPFYIGFTVACLISVLAPLSQAGFNPARDFSPCIIAAMAGWSSVAIPGPRNGFWVCILGSIISVLVGGFIYDFIVYPMHLVTNGSDDTQKFLIDEEEASHHSKFENGSVIASPATRLGSLPSDNRPYHVLSEAL